MKQLALALSLAVIAGASGCASGLAPCAGSAKGKAPSAPGVFDAREVIAALKDHILQH